MRSTLTIGEFATLTRLSVRTLRRYHAAGLLEPDTVDASTGYRYYAPAQIPTAQVIHQLRQLDVPLAEIETILAADDAQQRAAVVEGHLRRLEDELDRTRTAVVSLRRLLRPEPAGLQIEVRTLPQRTVAGITGHVRLIDSMAWYDSAMAELDSVFAPDECTGPPGGQYSNELFVQGAGTLTVFRPVRNPQASGRIEVVELPEIELAVTVHPGPHDDIDVTFGKLGAWVVDHALAVAGPIYETYVVGPRDTPEPNLWRTEIGWPVFPLAPAANTTAAE